MTENSRLTVMTDLTLCTRHVWKVKIHHV